MKKKSYTESLFSADWYLLQNPDVEGFPGGALAHYSLFGWREGRSPHPLFDVAWYLSQNPDMAAGDMEPCDHYMNHGWRAMRSPHPLFNPARYLLQNPDVVAADVDPWWHYLQTGWREGRSLNPLFDPAWYLEVYDDVARAGLEPLTHYLGNGWREGRSPHPLFDAGWYRAQYDVPQTVDCWQDYLQTGWREGRSPHPRFDAKWYQDSYLDPVALSIEPLGHYLDAGWHEGLLPHEGYVSAEGAAAESGLAPLYQELRGSSAAPATVPVDAAETPGDSVLRTDGRRGRILLVTHDTQLGGAQTVLRLFADWLVSSTRFSVGIVAVNGGHFRPDFEKIAPVFVLSDHAEEDRAAALADWAGEDVQAVFVNSIVSGAFYKYWPTETPSVAFIHELPQILERYPEEVALVRARTDHVICGGPGVFAALSGEFGFEAARMTSAYSYIEALPKGDTDTDREARRRAARAALGVPEERILVMGCGVLHWRKSPDKFIETAEAVLAAGLDAEFVWLGGGPDEEDCLRQAEAAGIAERVRFTGYEADVAGKLAGADIFLLSSQEDPFPLVALYAAQAGAPLVCFQEAGGIADFVQTGSGVAVPFMNIPAMAEAVLRYGRDEDLRARDGDTGRDQVARRHTIEAVGPLLLHHLRQAAGLKPEVSVVLPNYNYEDYLPQRLDSITAQTFQDFELILLDDASSDGSPQLLEAFAETRAGTKTALSTENSGSPFAQWLRGMDMAEGEIVWLAEADDWCEDNLLTTLLPVFDDRNVRLASCMSVPVQSDGTVIGDYPSLYLDRINPGRWNRDFVATDHEEANEGLGIANTIPNASAVLMRKFDPDPEFVETVTGMRLCGDWFFYIRAMKGGLVGFSAAPLNYHRRHGGTVTHKLEGSLRYFNELAEVRTYVGRTYHQSPQAQAQIRQFLEQDIARFNVPDPAALPKLPAPQKALPSLAVIAPDLSPGGGQMFAISLANEWARRGGRVVLVNAHSQPTHDAVVSKLNPEVALYHATDPGFDLAEIVRRYDIDLIHSNIWWSDALVDSYREDIPADLPWVITMHGCHETLMQHPGIDRAFSERMSRMTERVNAWVYLADKNIGVFDQYPRPETLLRIPNGMAEEPVRQPLERATLGLRPDAVVLCMAARAIPSKGWAEAVEVVEALNAEGHKLDLILCGEGPAADDIRARAPEHVLLTGQVPNVQDYFAISDIGILPSYFIGESLPLALIEMMAKGLPLIASDVGEIPSILGEGAEAAGVLIPLQETEDGKPGLDMAAFLEATRRMLDEDLRAQMGANARRRFDAEFRLDRMVDRYAALYEELGAGTGRD
ncbi:glycosyltransferase [Phaeobacter sp. SYSU ZJ3003]|uniref:glycosyltransferase n=1 Tax=Phaeobacter sp. SYSU ZJ3003 TaxID=2109330 RepID=UPI00351C88B6